jgi:hypothetical protein
MRNLPPELLIVAFLLALAIVQIIRNTRRKQPPPAPPPARREAAIERPQRRPWADAPDEVLAWSATRHPTHDVGRSAATFAVETTRSGRYSRKSLLGNREDLRRAVVIAAILNPCRAVRPEDDR